MRRPAPLPSSPERSRPDEGGLGEDATAHEEAAQPVEPAFAGDAAPHADEAERIEWPAPEGDDQVTAPIIPLIPGGFGPATSRADGSHETSDVHDAARDAAPDAAPDPVPDDPDAPVGLRDVWKAARARRRALRAEVRRFTVRARRRRMLWIGAITAFAVLVIGTLAAAYSPLFAVERITVIGANQLDVAAVEEALADQVGTPLPLVDDSAVKAALVRFPLIESYSLEARPPHDLVVRVVERTPIGVVHSAAGYTVVDGAGVALSTTPDAPPGLPVIDVAGGPGSDAFVAAGLVVRTLPEAIRAQVTAVSASTPDDVTLTLGGTNTQVVWGSAEKSVEKGVRLETIMISRPPADVSVYDVSSPGAIVVR